MEKGSLWEDLVLGDTRVPPQEDSSGITPPPKPMNPVLVSVVLILVSLMVATGAVLFARTFSNRVGSPRASASQSRGVVDVVARIADENVAAAGTGVVLTSSGVILTNNHVISGATSIEVTDPASGSSYPATVLGYDVANDVALLQASGARRLSTAVIGSSSRLAIGEVVIAVGNAGGAGGRPAASEGAVIALDQSVTAQDELDGVSETLAGVIETDASVVSGDSGGPLLTRAGQVVGMDTAASSGYPAESGGIVSFAIPINSAVRISDEIRYGRPSSGVHIGPTAFLGISILPDDPVPGAAVTAVLAGSPAAVAGLRAGDVIVSIGGLTVATPEALTTVMEAYQPGAAVVITWVAPDGTTHSALSRFAAGPPA